MRKLLILGSGLLLLAVLALPVWAGSEASVTATVTPELISVALTDESPSEVDYGVLGTGEVEKAPISDPAIFFENTGSVNERFYFKGADAVGVDNPGSFWELGSPASVDVYIHRYGTGTGPTTFTTLTKNHLNNLLGTISPGGTSVELHLRLSTPTTISDPSTAYSTSVTLVAVKAP